MVMDDTLIREVDEEIAQDRQTALVRKYAPLFIAALLLIVGSVGGRQYYEARKAGIAEENAIAYQSAGVLAETDSAAAITAFEALAAAGPDGYGALARLRAAALAASAGDRDKARALLAEITQGDAPQRVRDLARIRLAYLSLDQGPDAVRLIVNGLEIQNTPYGAFASEAVGLAAYGAEKFDEAYLMFERVMLHPEAQIGMRRRAESMAALADLGRQGVALEATPAPSAGEAGVNSNGLLGDAGALSSALQGAFDSLASGELDQVINEDALSDVSSQAPSFGTTADAVPDASADPAQSAEEAAAQSAEEATERIEGNVEGNVGENVGEDAAAEGVADPAGAAASGEVE